jgi:hypothetical protein
VSGRVAISGGRDYVPSQADIEAFWKIWDRVGGVELHHGGANGTDKYMGGVMRRHQPEAKIVVHLPDWDRQGKAAGPIRNRQMLAQADVLIAFPGGKGTDDCIRAARELNRPVWRVIDAGTPPHEHNPKSWTWNPARAVWDGVCRDCGVMYSASPEEYDRLEQAVERYVDLSPPWNENP